MKTNFPHKLLEWYRDNARDLPWVGIKNPYHIWLSEIILQQTRVEQGWPYFEKFVQHYPTIEDLAQASEEEVMKLWEGLGYYSRARNLHFTAKYIAFELDGQFPNEYENILALKGVGPYTAAAIASFAFNLPHAVLDGNVYRILSRYFGIKTPIDSTQGKKEFFALANQLLVPEKAAIYNQAIMDFAATKCTPAQPDCTTCTFNDSCWALAHKAVRELPVKSKKLKRRDRFFHFLVDVKDEHIYLQKRLEKDIWQNLFQMPLYEGEKMLLNATQLQAAKAWQDIFSNDEIQISQYSKLYKQTLTHQNIHACFFEIANAPKQESLGEKVALNALNDYAFPKIILMYLRDRGWRD